MTIKLFILGRPGSGKSTAYRLIKDYLSQQSGYSNWTTDRYNDYDILYEMFRREQLSLNYRKPNQFEAKEYNGFDVKDFTVLDTALKNLEKIVRQRTCEKKEELIFIEFARQDYVKAFKQFSPSFLKDSYFLFIDTDVNTCIERVRKRVTNPPTPDNHFVSEDILTNYYGKQIFPSLSRIHRSPIMNLSKHQARVIKGHGSLQTFNKRIETFINHIFVHSGHGYARAMPLHPYPVVNPQNHTPFHKKERQVIATRT